MLVVPSAAVLVVSKAATVSVSMAPSCTLLSTAILAVLIASQFAALRERIWVVDSACKPDVLSASMLLLLKAAS